MHRPDLTAPRPWVAVPERPGFPDSAWCVMAPSRHRGGMPLKVASYLSEEDARTMMAAHAAVDGHYHVTQYHPQPQEARLLSSDVMELYHTPTAVLLDMVAQMEAEALVAQEDMERKRRAREDAVADSRDWE